MLPSFVYLYEASVYTVYKYIHILPLLLQSDSYSVHTFDHVLVLRLECFVLRFQLVQLVALPLHFGLKPSAQRFLNGRTPVVRLDRAALRLFNKRVYCTHVRNSVHEYKSLVTICNGT